MKMTNNVRLFFSGFLFLLAMMVSFPLKAQNSSYFNIQKDKRPEMEQMMKSLDSMQNTIDQIQSDSRMNFQVMKNKDEFQADRQVIEALNSLFTRQFRSDYRNLTLYRSILEEIKTRNDEGKKEFQDLQDKYKKYKISLEAIPQKPAVQQMIKMEEQQNSQKNGNRKPPGMLKDLNSDWEKAYHNVVQNQDSLMRWTGTASFNSMRANDLLKTADSLIRENSRRMMSQSTPPPQKMAKKEPSAKMRAEFRNQTANSNKILSYYISKYSSSILWLPLLISVLLGIWIFVNYRKVRNGYAEYWSRENFPYLFSGFAVASLLTVFSFVHLVDINAPWIYLLSVQLVTYFIVIWILWKSKSRNLALWLLGCVVLLLVATFFSNTRPSNFQVYVILLLSAAEIFFLYKLFLNRKKFIQLPRLITGVLVLCLILSLFSIYLAIQSRWILSFILMNASLIGILQIITLSVVKELITESLVLQIVSSRISAGIHKTFDRTLIQKALHFPLLVVVLYLWLVMFSANLNIYENFSEQINKIISTPIKLGGAVFTLSGVLLFVAIIWAVTLLQKYIGYFFGDIGADEDYDFKSQRSKMTITKLIVICVGYLIAIVASGLPLDRITIVLSALSVGVGMGLQNIVNNFVSGIILIFDRPLQLGDLIEVKGQSGKVQEIGIRASTLVTEDGAEVIIPNGDILSNSITNWTLSNNLKRLTASFSIKTERNREEIRKLITDHMKTLEWVSQQKEVLVYFNGISESGYQIQIQYWSPDINRFEWVQSEVQFSLYQMFRSHDILVV